MKTKIVGAKKLSPKTLRAKDYVLAPCRGCKTQPPEFCPVTCKVKKYKPPKVKKTEMPAEAPKPSIRFDVWLVPHGYQIDLYVHGKEAGSECRDFGLDQDTEKLHDEVYAGLNAIVKNLRRK